MDDAPLPRTWVLGTQVAYIVAGLVSSHLIGNYYGQAGLGGLPKFFPRAADEEPCTWYGLCSHPLRHLRAGCSGCGHVRLRLWGGSRSLVCSGASSTEPARAWRSRPAAQMQCHQQSSIRATCGARWSVAAWLRSAASSFSSRGRTTASRSSSPAATRGFGRIATALTSGDR